MIYFCGEYKLIVDYLEYLMLFDNGLINILVILLIQMIMYLNNYVHFYNQYLIQVDCINLKQVF